MGWKNWSYKVRGMVVGITLVILIGLIMLIFFPFIWPLSFAYYRSLHIIIPSSIILGFFVGWIVDSIKKKDSFMKILLLVAVTYIIVVSAVLPFTTCVNKLSCFFGGYNGNNAWIVMIIPCFLLLVTGIIIYFVKKSKGNEINSKEFRRYLLILLAVILFLPLLHYVSMGMDKAYLEWAGTFNKVELCGRINGAGTRDFCYKLFSSKRNEPSLCENMVNKLEKGICFADFFRFKGYDASVCNLTQDEEAKDICFASSTSNGQDCSRIQNVASRDNCYKNYGSSFFTYNGSNYSFCSKIISIEMRDNCFEFVSSLEKNIDLGLCEEIQTQEIREECYATEAYHKQDASICDKIITAKIKEHCLSEIR